MKLNQLHYFRELAKSEHLTRTAEKLFISAPSLSASISKLEEELGVKLFDRIGRSLKLNRNGEILLQCANQVFNRIAEAKLQLQHQQDCSERLLNVATTAESLWTGPMQEFLSVNPEASICHHGVKLPKLANADFCSSMNFIITATRDIQDDRWDHRIIVEDYPVLVFAPGHRFEKLDEIDLEEAKDEKFIALSKGFSSRRFFDEVCSAAGFEPNIVCECDYLFRTKMVKENYGITISSALGMTAFIMSGLRSIPIIKPEYIRAQAIYWHKNRTLTPVETSFIEFFEEYHRRV